MKCDAVEDSKRCDWDHVVDLEVSVRVGSLLVRYLCERHKEFAQRPSLTATKKTRRILR